MRLFKKNAENTIFFVVFSILYLLSAYLFTIVLDTHHNDTVSRSALGYMVLYGRFPKLTNVGFVWTPLLSLLQLPLFPILKLIHHQDLAGPIVTAITAAATIPVINSIGINLNVNKWVRWAAVFFFGINPTIVVYAGVGMSETFFFLPFALCIFYLIKWMTGKMQYTALVISGSALAIAFWSRYEAIPILIAICVVVFLFIKEHKVLSVSFYHLFEAGTITFSVPSIYSIFLWVFFNWTIMGNPWYWWTGEYSNTAYTSVYQSQVNPLFHNLLASIIYAFGRVIYISPLFIFLSIVAAILAIKRKSWMPLTILIPSLVLIAFHIYQTFSGGSYGWYRFYSYGTIGSIWSFFWIWHFLSDKKNYRIAFEVISIGIMAITCITTTYAMFNPNIGKEESSLVSAFLPGGKVSADETRSYAAAKAVDQFLKTNDINNDPVLVDSFQGFAIILYADNPNIFVKTQDLDFKTALRDPIKYGIKWVLVPKPDESLRYSEWLYRTYPSIWEDPPQWLKLEQDFGAWRIYKVVQTQS
ncbi:MAG: hypothetical protein NTZ74_10395 [Chloroflexi bacterium]|nr:hypothetical protein [Chloroflexota bacterium]